MITVNFIFRRVYDAEWTGMKDLLPNKKSREKREVNTERIKCDVCKELKGEAVCYCLGCEQKLCDEHFKVNRIYSTLGKFATLVYILNNQ